MADKEEKMMSVYMRPEHEKLAEINTLLLRACQWQHNNSKGISRKIFKKIWKLHLYIDKYL